MCAPSRANTSGKCFITARPATRRATSGGAATATPSTRAWPPSFPSVPTSRATRVTSDANDRSWSTIVFTVFFSSRISPFTSTVIFRDRSPAATALVTSAMFRTWLVRLPAMKGDPSRSRPAPPRPDDRSVRPRRPRPPTEPVASVRNSVHRRWPCRRRVAERISDAADPGCWAGTPSPRDECRNPNSRVRPGGVFSD